MVMFQSWVHIYISSPETCLAWSSISSLLSLSSLKHTKLTFQGQKIREIYLSIPAENPTLGISLQWTPLSVTEDVWHILDVIPNSPADMAGLLPYGDYVIGSPEGLVRGESGLGELVEDVRVSPHPNSSYTGTWADKRRSTSIGRSASSSTTTSITSPAP
jgi:S1-C subfamily serine protease